jgi:hypothetical protein
MRTHYLDTRSRVKSVVMGIEDKPEGLRFYAPYLINGLQYDDIYDLTGVLVDEAGEVVKVRYERRD